MNYIDYVYYIVKTESSGMDAIYRDYIIQLVGKIGLNALISSKLLESCGIVSGRQLYTLCDKK